MDHLVQSPGTADHQDRLWLIYTDDHAVQQNYCTDVKPLKTSGTVFHLNTTAVGQKEKHK